MKFGAVPVEESEGAVLAHTLTDDAGHKLLNKGHVLNADDIIRLQSQGITSVIVARLAPDDVGENEAARRVGQAVAGEGLKVTAPGVGRANLATQADGVLHIDVDTLHRLNGVDEGITVATLPEHSLVRAGQLLALVKIIPFAIAAASIDTVESMMRDSGAVLHVALLQSKSVALILAGSESARESLFADYTVPVQQRLDSLGSTLSRTDYVPYTVEAVANAICDQQRRGTELVIVAGMSATIDHDDVLPTALRAAGANEVHFGVPVDPGNLLVLGYLDSLPVIGAPSCAKSLKQNVIDLVLARLLTGEHLGRTELVRMGHGGLLDDISERPMPRFE